MDLTNPFDKVQFSFEQADSKLDLIIELLRIEKDDVPWLSMEEVVERTGYKLGGIKQLIRKKEIPHYKRGKMIVFKKSEIAAWMFEDKQHYNGVPELEKIV